MTINYEHILDNLPGVTLICDDEANPRIAAIKGTTRALFGAAFDPASLTRLNDLRQLVADHHSTDISTTTRSALSCRRPWDVEYEIATPDGTRWIREQATFRACDAEHSPALTLYLSDITEQKLLTQRLTSQRDNAQRHVELKNDFFASMSHEIRTPMNGVMGMAQVLSKTHLDNEQRQYVSTVIESSNALLSIINDILDLSKIEAGKLDLNPEPFDLEKATYDVCQLLASRASEKGIALLLDYRQIFPKKVITDSGRLRQILLNLLGNAIKFTEQGHVLLTVECQNIDSDSADFLFKIVDTGVGIPASAQQNLFAAYTQADESIAGKFGGTGLGLQISKCLVERMKGEIGVHSAPGQGSTFWFKVTFPIVPETAGISLVDLTNKNALVIDENNLSNKILTRYLEDAGSQVTSLTNAEDALALLSDATHYNFALIDKNTRGIDGVKLTKLIKSSKHHTAMPVLLLTSVIERADSRLLRKAGVNAYLPKPVSCNLVYRALNTILKSDLGGDESIFIANDDLVAHDENINRGLKISARILVAEDVEVNQMVLNAMLSDLGCAVDFADNGNRALVKWQQHDYDLIFMDCKMPEMDGYTATRYIKRSSSPKANVPIIALTANATESDRQQCLNAGMDDFLTKPFTESALVKKLTKWLDIEESAFEASELTTYDVDTSDDTVLDLVRFNKLKSMLKENFDDFTVSALEKFDERLNTITYALGDGKMAELHDTAHALKGLAGMIGAKIVFDLAGALEQAGKEEDLAKANLNVAKLEKAIDAARAAIRDNVDAELDRAVVLF